MMERFTAVVEDVREHRRVGGRAVWQLALSETRFHGDFNGVLIAVSRQGSRLELRVLAVEADARGIFWHTVEKPLAAGTEVVGELR